MTMEKAMLEGIQRWRYEMQQSNLNNDASEMEMQMHKQTRLIMQIQSKTSYQELVCNMKITMKALNSN